MSTKRRLPNWLDAFMQWTVPRSIAKESLLFWSGLFTLSATLGRRVVIGKQYLGGWEVYPPMYVVFVGPQGVITKSTTIGFSESLLQQVPDLHQTPSIYTAPVLGEHLVKSHDSAVFTIASEFGSLMEKDEKLYTIFTDMFDNKAKFHEETIGRGVKMADRPCLSLLGATTPKWISINMSSAVLGGGFGSRVIYIREDEPRHRRLFHFLYKTISQEEVDQLENDLVHDLNHIRQQVEGEFEIPRDVATWFDKWHIDNPPPKGVHENMLGFYARREAHIMKLAMLHSVATKDELILTQEDFQFGIDQVAKILPHITRVVTGVGNNPYKGDADSITKYIKEKGRVEKPELLRAFNAAASPEVLERLIDGLVNSEVVIVKLDKDKKVPYMEINPEFDE